MLFVVSVRCPSCIVGVTPSLNWTFLSHLAARAGSGLSASTSCVEQTRIRSNCRRYTSSLTGRLDWSVHGQWSARGQC